MPPRSNIGSSPNRSLSQLISSDARVSMRADVARVLVRDTADRLAALAAAEGDVREAGRVAELTTEEGDTFSVDVVLA